MSPVLLILLTHHQGSRGQREHPATRVNSADSTKRLACLRQSRYCERAKTRFQLYLAATVANLTLVAAKAGLTGETGSGPPSAGRALVAGIANPAAWLGQFTTLTLLAAALLTKSFSSTRGFRPSF